VTAAGDATAFRCLGEYPGVSCSVTRDGRCCARRWASELHGEGARQRALDGVPRRAVPEIENLDVTAPVMVVTRDNGNLGAAAQTLLEEFRLTSGGLARSTSVRSPRSNAQNPNVSR
jgi:hypothetical protein